MKRLFVAALLVVLLASSAPAAAWDPDYVPDIQPVEPAAPSGPDSPDPALVAPDGIYLVTDIYVGDATTRSGQTTTYETVTAHDTPGTWARVLESVTTGGASTFDGASFNVRTTLSDGRPVAGTYYQDYILTDAGFVPVNIVFFQDDTETAVAPASAGPPIAPAGPEAPARAPEPVAAPAPTERDIEPVEPPASATPSTLPDRTIEVLRGRLIALDFSQVSGIRDWRYVSGEATIVGAASGAAADRFRARWDRLAPPGAAWAVRFTIDLTDGSSRDLTVRVIVRSPGLVP